MTDVEYPQVTMAMVMSVDGRTTDDKHSTAQWSSLEDQAHFAALKETNDAIIMGRQTYDAVRTMIQPDPEKPRIIMTRNPEAYTGQQVPGLQFSDQTPQRVLGNLAASGHKRVLLAGGAITNSLFLDARCVDTIVLTVEPLLFGRGEPLVNTLSDAISLRLQDVQKLGTQAVAIWYGVSYGEER